VSMCACEMSHSAARYSSSVACDFCTICGLLPAATALAAGAPTGGCFGAWLSVFGSGSATERRGVSSPRAGRAERGFGGHCEAASGPAAACQRLEAWYGDVLQDRRAGPQAPGAHRARGTGQVREGGPGVSLQQGGGAGGRIRGKRRQRAKDLRAGAERERSGVRQVVKGLPPCLGSGVALTSCSCGTKRWRCRRPAPRRARRSTRGHRWRPIISSHSSDSGVSASQSVLHPPEPRTAAYCGDARREES
jgi:hypothetical protein